MNNYKFRVLEYFTFIMAGGLALLVCLFGVGILYDDKCLISLHWPVLGVGILYDFMSFGTPLDSFGTPLDSLTMVPLMYIF